MAGGKPAEPPEAGGDPGQPGHVGPGQDGGGPPHLPRVQEPRPHQPHDGVRRGSDDEVGGHETGESAACAALRRLHDAAPETGRPPPPNSAIYVYGKGVLTKENHMFLATLQF